MPEPRRNNPARRQHGDGQALRFWLCWLGGWLASSAHAGQLGFGIGYIGEYTDNMQRLPANPQEEWTNSVSAGVAYRDDSPELAANVRAQVEHRDYTREIYPDETVGYLASAAVWTVVPRRLQWAFVDRLDQLPQSATSAFTPANRDTVNVIETGPDVLVSLNPVDVLVLGARAGNTWMKEGDADHDRFAAIFRWRHQIDATSQFSLNLQGQKIAYTDAPATPTDRQDYLREDLYLRYDRRQPWSRLVLDLGGTRIMPEDGVEDLHEPLLRLNLARRLSSDSAVGLSLGHETMEVGTALLAGVADPTLPEPISAPVAVPADLAAGDVFVSRHGEVFYNRSGPYVGVRADAFQRDLDYQTLLPDRIETGARLQVAYNFTPTLTAGAYGGALKTEYQEVGRLDRDVSYGVVLTYRLSTALTLGLEGSHTERVSSDPLADYQETHGLVRFMYSSNPLFTPAAR
jgi:hypothetical protein